MSDDSGTENPIDRLNRIGSSPEAVAVFVAQNSPNWTLAQAQRVRDWLVSNGGGGAQGEFAVAYNQLFLDHAELTTAATQMGPQAPTTEGGGVITPAGPLEPPPGVPPDLPQDFLDDLDEALHYTGPDGTYPDARTTAIEVGESAGLSDEEIDAAIAWAESQQTQTETGEVMPTDVVDEQLPTPAEEAAPPTPGEAITQRQQENIDHAVEVAAGALTNRIVTARTTPGGVVNFNITEFVEGIMPGTIPEAQQSEFIRRVTEQGKLTAVAELTEYFGSQGFEPDQAKILAARGVDEMTAETSTPTWMMEATGRDLTQLEKDRLVAYYNDLHGTHGQYRTWEDLAPVFTEESADNLDLLNAATTDQEPTRAMQVRIPGRGEPQQVMMNGRLVTVPGQSARTITATMDQVEELQARGYSMDAIMRIIRLGGMYGLPGQDEDADADRVESLIRLTLATSNEATAPALQEVEEISQRITEMEAELGLKPGEYMEMTAEERKAYVEKRAREHGVAEAGHYGIPESAGMSSVVLGLGADLDAAIQRRYQMQFTGPTQGITRSQTAFNAGLTMYGQDTILALIHAVDAPLAARIAAVGGDPDKLAAEDERDAERILRKAGIIDSSMWDQQGSVTDLLRANARGGGGGGGGAGPVRRLIDPVATKEALTAMYQALLLGEPGDEMVSSFTKDLQAQLDRTPEGQSFDPQARINEFLKSLPQYAELYGKKPGALSDAQYQAQFQAAQASMLGAEASSSDAVKQGMRTGQYQTTVGAAAATTEAWNNSTFLGRLARSAQVVDEMT